MVSWKKQKGHTELFASLEVFVESYPSYPQEELVENFAFGKNVFEDDQLLIERKKIITTAKPGFPRVFFWELDYDKINWEKSSTMVIQRVLERGTQQPRWDELIRFYGKNVIVEALKSKISFLPDEMIDDASSFFNLKKEEMVCYKRNQSQPRLWL